MSCSLFSQTKERTFILVTSEERDEIKQIGLTLIIKSMAENSSFHLTS